VFCVLPLATFCRCSATFWLNQASHCSPGAAVPQFFCAKIPAENKNDAERNKYDNFMGENFIFKTKLKGNRLIDAIKINCDENNKK
jgi:hypothetical protein